MKKYVYKTKLRYLSVQVNRIQQLTETYAVENCLSTTLYNSGLWKLQEVIKKPQAFSMQESTFNSLLLSSLGNAVQNGQLITIIGIPDHFCAHFMVELPMLQATLNSLVTNFITESFINFFRLTEVYIVIVIVYLTNVAKT